MDCGGPDVLVTANFVERALRASGCFCGRMPPKWGPCGAARVRRKVRRMARTMRASSLHAHGCAFNEPRSALAHSEGRMPGERATGVCFFRLPFFAQAKKGDSLAQRASESFAPGQSRRKSKMDSRFRGNDVRKGRGNRSATVSPSAAAAAHRPSSASAERRTCAGTLP